MLQIKRKNVAISTGEVNPGVSGDCLETPSHFKEGRDPLDNKSHKGSLCDKEQINERKIIANFA